MYYLCFGLGPRLLATIVLTIAAVTRRSKSAIAEAYFATASSGACSGSCTDCIAMYLCEAL